MPVRSTSKRKVYKFVHRRDEYIVTNIKGVIYEDPDGWIKLYEDGTLHICGSNEKGYAWDGCTPKWEVLDLIIGTPDGRLDYFTEEPITYYASMVHDIVYQFKREIGLSRRTADLLFLKILKESGFFWSWLYYFAVRLAGMFYGPWKERKTPRDIRIIRCSWIERAYEEMKSMQVEKKEKHPFYMKGQEYNQNQNIKS